MLTSITQTRAWKDLLRHYDKIRRHNIKDLFRLESNRAENFSMNVGDIFADYSKNLITQETLSLLMALAREAEVEEWRDRMFGGEIVNTSENQAATHTLIRDLDAGKSLDGSTPYARIAEFAEDVRSGRQVGYDGQKFRHIACLGIGGSRAGNEMGYRMLKDFSDDALQLHFASAPDHSIIDLQNRIDLSRTLFIVISKSFSTRETMMNASYMKDALTKRYANQDAWEKHFAGVSADAQSMEAYGIAKPLRFLMPQSVGGRYSIWSAAGLPLLIMIGAKRFSEFLRGARAMDTHFAEQPLERNMPVVLGLIGLWYASFFKADSRAVLTYGAELEQLGNYLQQLEMESNGKSVTRDGVLCDYPTAPVVWGGSAADGQHAFFQMLHQGTRLIPIDFVALKRNAGSLPSKFNDFMHANLLAQASALMSGQQGTHSYQKQIGNRPSNVITLETMSPYNLGSLIAFYEHRTFVQAVVWAINPFDQWGVELGKHISERLLSDLSERSIADGVDSSTANLMRRYLS